MIPFSFTGNAGTTLSHVVVPAGGRDRVRVQYVSATSDKAASLITFRAATAKAATVTATSAANQTVINCVPYAGAAASDVVVLFSKATGTGVRGVVASVQAGVSITLNANLGLALAPGDTVHLMAAAGQIPVGAATKEANAPTVFVVHEGPALVELDGTAACRINLVAGEYS